MTSEQLIVESEPRPGRSRRRVKTALKVIVTTAICGSLYVAADWRAVLRELRNLDAVYFATAMALFVPQTIVSALRWRRLVATMASNQGSVKAASSISVPMLRSAVAQTLASSALNLVVPSKLGDFSKAAFIATDDLTTKGRLAKLVVWEKLGDLAALFVAAGLCVSATRNFVLLGLLVFAATVLVGRSVVRRRGKKVAVDANAVGSFLAATIALWTLHLWQVHAFVRAVGIGVPWTATFARAPFALLAGIVPAAFCGIGTRDAAFVWLFADVAPASAMAVVGLLTALRYIVPGIVGLPLLWRLKCEPGEVSASPSSTTFQRRFAADPSDKSPSRRRDAPARESTATL